MALTGRQIRQLRSLAHHLEPVVMIGKADINDGIVAQANDNLEAHELIKCSVLDSSMLTAREAADELADRCGAEIVQVIGRRFSLYRLSSRKNVEHIKLD
ncbi:MULTISPECIES: ribosome assembly RNA-binding protein YhbY [Collinsella]|uniref:ribosome assembly RNA-binding protein YhbY n=1 Tax=Collinsella TaxID=102106 RepID=UPI000B386918|nr:MULTISPECIES: ribosome assembly RNA-binding protein YhbY [Collinsella]MBM6683678.1 ribosome assembly RNA-binding protein YhbY [Collinsella intestinalis]OUN48098.1 RNA-binding protein [Collinsella sp. An7]